ncbi:hypothetical protein [Solidesulfovibrio sp.]|uniref:hypothetical protein n=1 Tax=Solidesulfovibrio sp. TaxID=2910990 RepID=UPI00262F5319|nr:hypothetical protein [Solidesulfovibrio sp.]
MRQIAQVLRQNNIPEAAVRAALLGMCGVGVMLRDSGTGVESATTKRFLGVEE